MEVVILGWNILTDIFSTELSLVVAWKGILGVLMGDLRDGLAGRH